MAVFKCKMCGGTIEINNNESVATCEYCGTKQTLPKLDNEQKINLYDRANHFRRNNDYDKAMAIYENILNTDTTDAEAYWSILLCRFGVEYVEDPSTHKQVPTINRAQFTSVFADEDYKSAIEYASPEQKEIYKQEAAYIDEVQKGILEISNKEEPFDVFICYKETDSNGRRTRDSVLATELYHGLVNEGFKVFFSRITLEDKLGQEYEPYIFAALNSAKVMVVIGTRPEHFNAVWVKNEWSRYLTLVKKSNGQKILIPAYKDMDPYDLPEEFSHLQAQDMSKLGFMQDLIRGIKKIVVVQETVKETVVVNNESNVNTGALLKRVFLFLEDGEWARADEFCEQVLNIDPECAEAYIGKLMIELRVKKQEALKDLPQPFDNSGNYLKTVRFADGDLKNTIIGYVNHIKNRNEQQRLESIYISALDTMNNATDPEVLVETAEIFDSIKDYKDSQKFKKSCLEKAEDIRKDNILSEAKGKMIGEIVSNYESAIDILKTIPGWKDADETVSVCEEKIAEFRKQAAVRAKFKKIIAAVTAVLIVFIIVLNTTIIPSIKYNDAIALMDNKDYMNALAAFSELGDFKDSKSHYSYIMNEIAVKETIFAGKYHTVGLKSDGTVVAVGDNSDGQCDVSDWTDIVTVSVGVYHTVGLKSDGTVVAVGGNRDGQCDVSEWTDIVAVSVGVYHTVGLKYDGTVVATTYTGNYRNQCDVSDWTDIVGISAGKYHTVGLKSDGTVVAVGDNSYGQCDVSEWTDIVAISAGDYHTVGIKSDGTVVATTYTGNFYRGQCDVSEWTDIVEISADSCHTVGLKSDGTVVAVGNNESGQCNITLWTDIVAISSGGYHTVGLKSDGTLVATGDNTDGQCDVSDWKNIRLSSVN